MFQPVHFLKRMVREMLTTHILTHTLQHSFWSIKIYMGPTWFGGTHVNFIQSKRVCWKVCVRIYVASLPHSEEQEALHEAWTCVVNVMQLNVSFFFF